MAFSKSIITNTDWTLIGDNANTITFQNVGQAFLYINVTDSNTAPTEEYGLVYSALSGEMAKTVADMSANGSATHVWARSTAGNTTVVYETA